MQKIKIKFLTLVFLAVTVASFAVPAGNVQAAASMYFSPSSGNFTAGRTFGVNVLLSAPEAANALSGAVAFDTSLLEVTSLNKSGSKVSVWVREPSFSNSSGTISFEGIIPNPGYTGTGGKVIGITFRAKGQGAASVRFSGGKVLANDGNGTNITGGLGSARYNIGETEPAAPGVPATPRIQSSTHPDSNSWYANNQPQFKWGIPSGVTAVSTLVNDSPNSDPGNKSGVVSSLSLKDHKNGVSYVHVKFRNAQGWGPVAHYKFQVDLEQPSGIEIQKQDTGYLITAVDQFSGIDHFEWKEEDGEFKKLEAVEGYYEFEGLSAGDHQIVVKAIDRAQNSSEKTVTVVGEGKVPVMASQGGFALNWWWLVGLFAVLLSILLVSWYRKRPKKKAVAAIGERHENKDFLAIADEMLAQISILEHAKANRKLTPEESKLLKRIHSSLQDVEKLLEPGNAKK